MPCSYVRRLESWSFGWAEMGELMHLWGNIPNGISPPLGNADEPSRPFARYWETPMVGKLAPLPLRLMLRTSQPTRFESVCFYILGSTPDPNLPSFTTGVLGLRPQFQTWHNRHLNSGWIARSPSRSVSEGHLPTIGVEETAISLPECTDHENQPVFSKGMACSDTRKLGIFQMHLWD